MPQFFKLWSPVQGSGSYFSIESVVDNAEGLRIYLRETCSWESITSFFLEG
jgi:hypothetical protein